LYANVLSDVDDLLQSRATSLSEEGAAGGGERGGVREGRGTGEYANSAAKKVVELEFLKLKIAQLEDEWDTALHAAIEAEKHKVTQLQQTATAQQHT